MSKRVLYAVVVLIALMLTSVGTASYFWDRERKARLVAEDKATALALEKAGLERALELKPTEVVKLVEKIVPKEVIKLVEQEKVVPITSIKVETREVPVAIPCGDPSVTFETTVRLSGGFFLGTTRLGKPYWTKQLFVHLRGVPEPIDFSNDPGIVLGYSSEIEKMIRDAALNDVQRFALLPRPFRQWRFGWTAGVGPCYALVDGGLDLCPAAVLGVQF